MTGNKTKIAPTYPKLINPTYKALLELGGSANNNEIRDKVIIDMSLSDEQADVTHLGNINQTELEYQLAWARTYLKNYGVLENSGRGVWTLTPLYAKETTIVPKDVIAATAGKKKAKISAVPTTPEPEDDNPDNDNTEFPDEIKPWKQNLSEILQNMDPYAFERLAQRLLRESGFSQVVVTKKTGDGGIDGLGRLKINGIFSFSVAFQCKRYKAQVGASDIRDFRGSLTTDIEKGVFITTGTFSKQAREEASKEGKKRIDLIDGEEFIDKLAEYGIGLKKVTTYEIDESFFDHI